MNSAADELRDCGSQRCGRHLRRDGAHQDGRERLRVRGALFEFGHEDLGFDDAEASEEAR